jgi:hypothetical protein
MINDSNTFRAVDAEQFAWLVDAHIPSLAQLYTFESHFIVDGFKTFHLKNEKVNPVFSYAYLSHDLINSGKEGLKNLRLKILQADVGKSIVFLYLEKLDEMELWLSMADATINNKPGIFFDINESLYGAYDDAYGRTIAASYAPDTSVLASQPVCLELQENYEQVAGKLYSLLPEASTETGVLSARQLCDWWNSILPGYAKGWRCQLNSKTAVLSVRNKSKLILIPAMRKYKATNALGLFFHEVGVHVQRYENGLSSKLNLLSVGTAGYQGLEEGLGLLVEQLPTGAFKLRGKDKYAAIAIARGCGDGTKKDFVQLYDYLEPHMVNRFKSKRIVDAERKAQLYTWRLCCRTFRGGFPDVPGAVNLKGKIYLDGLRKLSQAIHRDINILNRAFLGKFDPTNHEQVKCIDSALE